MLLHSVNSSRALLGNVRVASVLATSARRASVKAMSTAKALVFERNGEPADVLQLKEQQLPEVGEQDVQIQIIAVSAVHRQTTHHVYKQKVHTT